MSSGAKWSRRNGSQYRRLCARAGCGAPAVGDAPIPADAAPGVARSSSTRTRRGRRVISATGTPRRWCCRAAGSCTTSGRRPRRRPATPPSAPKEPSTAQAGARAPTGAQEHRVASSVRRAEAGAGTAPRARARRGGSGRRTEPTAGDRGRSSRRTSGEPAARSLPPSPFGPERRRRRGGRARRDPRRAHPAAPARVPQLSTA